MAVFIELTTDAFQEGFQTRAKNQRLAGRAGVNSVRRPLRGVEVKEDTYAIIKVIRSDGQEMPLFDAGDPSGESTSYGNFMLQAVQDARMEKQQIVETFGEPYIFFFGERPRFLDITATLINSLDFNWKAEFLENYDKYLRGTKLVEMGARMYLFYDDTIVEGYLVMCQLIDDVMSPMVVRMQLKLFLTNYSNVSFIGDPNYPMHQSVNLPPSAEMTSADAFSALTNATGSNDPSINEAAGLEDGTFGGGSTVSDLLRQGLVSSPYPGQDVGSFLTNASNHFFGSTTVPPGFQRELPIRGKISDNADEWTAPRMQAPFDPAQTEEENVEDLGIVTVGELEFVGADTDNPQAQQDMGILPDPNDPLAKFGLSSDTPFSSSSHPGTVV